MRRHIQTKVKKTKKRQTVKGNKVGWDKRKRQMERITDEMDRDEWWSEYADED
tara:strand:- start:477 stop:635 length:159 start_codon:yes stop_codon:yes gene_type:complete